MSPSNDEPSGVLTDVGEVEELSISHCIYSGGWSWGSSGCCGRPRLTGGGVASGPGESPVWLIRESVGVFDRRLSY